MFGQPIELHILIKYKTEVNFCCFVQKNTEQNYFITNKNKQFDKCKMNELKQI